MDHEAPTTRTERAGVGIEALHVYLIAARRHRERYGQLVDEMSGNPSLTECERRRAIARVHEELHEALAEERASLEREVAALRRRLALTEGEPALREFDRLYDSPELREFRDRLFEPHAESPWQPPHHTADAGGRTAPGFV